MALLTIKQAAAALSVSQQWLKYWLVENPVDTNGIPFYLRMGNRFKFEPPDIERIVVHLRLLEATRLGPSIISKGKLPGLMAKVGDYDHLVAVREAAEQRKRSPKPVSLEAKLLGELAIASVLGPRPPKKPPKRRLRPPAQKASGT